jgi:hypothetical protein
MKQGDDKQHHAVQPPPNEIAAFAICNFRRNQGNHRRDYQYADELIGRKLVHLLLFYTRSTQPTIQTTQYRSAFIYGCND